MSNSKKPMCEKAELLSIPFSPWTRRVVWAFFYAKVPYKATVYSPLTSEYWTRFRLRDWKGPISVPILFVKGRPPIRESLQIAEWIDERNTEGPGKLFPPGIEAEVKAWNVLADDVTCYIRSLSFASIRKKPESIRARRRVIAPQLNGMSAVPGADKVLDAIFLRVVLGLAKKYSETDAKSNEAKALAAVQKLEAALKGGKETIFKEGLTYSDIVMAVTLDFFLTAIESGNVDVSPELKENLESLRPWKDALFTKYFPQKQ